MGKSMEHPLTEKEKDLIRVCQGNIPVCEQPFREIAVWLDVDETWVLETLQRFQDAGILRQFRAILYHQNAGYRANGMSVWAVPDDRIDEVGEKMASYAEVSHCYQRPALPDWNYNMYGMIHARSTDEVEAIALRISADLGIDDYQILYSTREFKKTSMKYFVPELEDEGK